MNHLNILSLQETEYDRVVKGLVIGYARKPEAYERSNDFQTPTNLVVVSTTKEASQAFVNNHLSPVKNPDYGNIKTLGVRDIPTQKIFPVKGYVIFTPDVDFVNDYFFTEAVELFVSLQPNTGALFFDRVSLIVPDHMAARMYDALFTLWKRELPNVIMTDRPKRDEDPRRPYLMFCDKLLLTRTREFGEELEGRAIHLTDELDAIAAWFLKETLPLILQRNPLYIYMPPSLQRKLFLHDISQSQFLSGDFIGQVCEEGADPEGGEPDA